MIKDITGYYKPAVLLALYNAARHEGEGAEAQRKMRDFFSSPNDLADLESAEKYLRAHGEQRKIDYISLTPTGFKKKLCLLWESDRLDLTVYIREHGQNAVDEAFRNLDSQARRNEVNTRGFMP